MNYINLKTQTKKNQGESIFPTLFCCQILFGNKKTNENKSYIQVQQRTKKIHFQAYLLRQLWPLFAATIVDGIFCLIEIQKMNFDRAANSILLLQYFSTTTSYAVVLKYYSIFFFDVQRFFALKIEREKTVDVKKITSALIFFSGFQVGRLQM